MVFMFRFNVDKIISTRTTVVTLGYITCHHATMALLIFDNLFCSPTKMVIPCALFSLKLLYFHDFQAYKFHLNYCIHVTVFLMPYDVSDKVWDFEDVEYLICRTFGIWNV